MLKLKTNPALYLIGQDCVSLVHKVPCLGNTETALSHPTLVAFLKERTEKGSEEGNTREEDVNLPKYLNLGKVVRLQG